FGEGLLALPQRGRREEVRDPAPPEGGAEGQGRDRVADQAFPVGGLVCVQPCSIPWVRGRPPVQGYQARGRLGQRGDDEPAGREGIRADSPPAHSFASMRNFTAAAPSPPMLGGVRTYRELFRAPEFMPLFLASSVQVAALTMSSLALGTL